MDTILGDDVSPRSSRDNYSLHQQKDPHNKNGATKKKTCLLAPDAMKNDMNSTATDLTIKESAMLLKLRMKAKGHLKIIR